MQIDSPNYIALYKTTPRIYGVLSGAIPHKATFHELEIEEFFKEDAHRDIRPGLGSYKITITANVSSRGHFNVLGGTWGRAWDLGTGLNS
jgi:hypothetical protein